MYCTRATRFVFMIILLKSGPQLQETGHMDRYLCIQRNILLINIHDIYIYILMNINIYTCIHLWYLNSSSENTYANFVSKEFNKKKYSCTLLLHMKGTHVFQRLSCYSRYLSAWLTWHVWYMSGTFWILLSLHRHRWAFSYKSQRRAIGRKYLLTLVWFMLIYVDGFWYTCLIHWHIFDTCLKYIWHLNGTFDPSPVFLSTPSGFSLKKSSVLEKHLGITWAERKNRTGIAIEPWSLIYR